MNSRSRTRGLALLITTNSILESKHNLDRMMGELKDLDGCVSDGLTEASSVTMEISSKVAETARTMHKSAQQETMDSGAVEFF